MSTPRTNPIDAATGAVTVGIVMGVGIGVAVGAGGDGGSPFIAGAGSAVASEGEGACPGLIDSDRTAAGVAMVGSGGGLPRGVGFGNGVAAGDSDGDGVTGMKHAGVAIDRNTRMKAEISRQRPKCLTDIMCSSFGFGFIIYHIFSLSPHDLALVL